MASRFATLPDYIQGVTWEIWEGRRISSLHQAYGKEMIARSTLGVMVGAADVINDTLASLSAFPDRQIYGDDVIWSGDDVSGFLSSHRSMIIGTHSGHGVFGPPTGKVVAARAIADCYVRDEVILDEWLCYDMAAMVRQLGHSPEAWARTSIAREGGAEQARRPFTPQIDLPGHYTGRGNDHPLGQRLADILTRIMDKDISVIGQEYDRAVNVTHSGGVTGWGILFAEAQWMQFRTCFPDAVFRIDHQIGRADSGQPDRAALRWSLMGQHTGFGIFGAPTGAPIHVMGFTHAEFGPWGLRREFSLWDEVSIWKQILLSHPDHSYQGQIQ
jgi:predicted ester cyclase